jgi:hypothetical protein
MHRLKRLVTAAAVPLVVAVLAIVRRSYVVDDGFIFARVASSIARGDGWAYNHGEPVNAMTSVIWTLVLAGGRFRRRDRYHDPGVRVGVGCRPARHCLVELQTRE